LIGRELFRKPTRVVDELLKSHASFPDDDAAAIKLVKRAPSRKSERQLRLTNRTGWHEGFFVYPNQTYGALAIQLHHEGQTDIDPALGLKRGTVEAWREGMMRPCNCSDYLVLTLSVAASGPLLELIDEEEGGIFHLQPSNDRNAGSG
jgi:uncharacterized protein (DUF927 family)